MIGSRTRIVLLTSFFVCTFAMMFLALSQNYAHAATLVYTADVQSVLDHEIVPSFGTSRFDFDSDDSFQKYLSVEYPFGDTDYVPKDLVSITSNFTANDVRKFKLREEASIQFADMAWHFRDAFKGDRLAITSAYRSVGFQDYLVKQ